MPGRQYGAPKRTPEMGTQPLTPGRSVGTPQVKQTDPSPPTRVVQEFHKNAPVDSQDSDIHHTLGIGANQAAKGSHNHLGGDSVLLLDGVTLTGSKGGNAALASVISALVKLGAKDSTT